ncbi:hypothetical protein [Streptomyces sp. NPDC018347]|uniref:hypothetical protein n=1 Tax=Streptomyces sp. NPDC018347 TaxID=3157193 RepID=UPI0033EDA9B1
MLRGTTVRCLLTLLSVTLLAFQLFAPTGTFAPAHTFGQALTKTETGTPLSAQWAREGADTIRVPGRPGAPLSLPPVRDRHRGPATGEPREHPLTSGREAEAGPSYPAGAPHHPASRAAAAHAPAALQVFRC